MNWDRQYVTVRGHRFNTYYKAATGGTEDGPLFIFHHGMGSSASTFAILAMGLEEQLPNCGLVAYDARFHGLSNPVGDEPPTFDIEDLVEDFVAIIAKFDLTSVGVVLIGHSMGANVVSKVCAARRCPNVKGLVVLDAVEEYAQKSLASMPSLVSSWPESFVSEDEAISWAMRHLLRNKDSASISIPATLIKRSDNRLYFKVDLLETSRYWDSWFKDLDAAFLTSPAARLLILAGTGRLDKQLLVGQMQGKYQLVVLNECNHFLHEDAPDKVVHTLIDFWERNSAPARIIPKFGSFR